MAPTTLSLMGPPLRVREDAAGHLPPSAHRIFGLLRDAGALTHAQIALRTGMPARTIRFAVRRLREQGLVSSIPSLRDCRTCYLFVNRESAGAPAPEPLRLPALLQPPAAQGPRPKWATPTSLAPADATPSAQWRGPGAMAIAIALS